MQGQLTSSRQISLVKSCVELDEVTIAHVSEKDTFDAENFGSEEVGAKPHFA